MFFKLTCENDISEFTFNSSTAILTGIVTESKTFENCIVSAKDNNGLTVESNSFTITANYNAIELYSSAIKVVQNLSESEATLVNDTCSNGGILFYTGIDTNGNGELDTDERNNEPQIVCNGNNGTNGRNGVDGENGTNGETPTVHQALIQTLTDVTTSCPNGGIIIEVGLDSNSNGTLDSDEVQNSSEICNGNDGTNGVDGQDGNISTSTTLIKTETLAPSADCSAGTTKIYSGIDTNSNKILDEIEITNTEIICNQIDLSPLRVQDAYLDEANNNLVFSFTKPVNPETLNFDNIVVEISSYSYYSYDTYNVYKKYLEDNPDLNITFYLNLNPIRETLESESSDIIFKIDKDFDNLITGFAGDEIQTDYNRGFTLEFSESLILESFDFGESSLQLTFNDYVELEDINNNAFVIKNPDGSTQNLTFSSTSEIQIIDEGDYIIESTGNLKDSYGNDIFIFAEMYFTYEVNKFALNNNFLNQFGGLYSDSAEAIVSDENGNIYITGSTKSELNSSNAGDEDIWLAKYNSNGEQIWLKQFGGSEADYSKAIALDNENNIYITGNTSSDLNGTNAGESDVLLAKYNVDGNQIWLKQFGSSYDDTSLNISIDENNTIYLSGKTGSNLYDVWFAKYDIDGNRILFKQLESPESENCCDEYKSLTYTSVFKQFNNYFYAITDDSTSSSSSESTTYYLNKYDINGSEIWSYSIGYERSDFYGDSSDRLIFKAIEFDKAGNIYILENIITEDYDYDYYYDSFCSDGYHYDSSTNTCYYSLYQVVGLTKLNGDGDEVWNKILGAVNFKTICDLYEYDESCMIEYYSTDTYGSDLFIGENDNVYITGRTKYSNDLDVWFSEYDTDGNQISIDQFGGSNDDQSNAIFVDKNNSIYLTGSTKSNLGGLNAGNEDIWLAKISETE